MPVSGQTKRNLKILRKKVRIRLEKPKVLLAWVELVKYSHKSLGLGMKVVASDLISNTTILD